MDNFTYRAHNQRTTSSSTRAITGGFNGSQAPRFTLRQLQAVGVDDPLIRDYWGLFIPIVDPNEEPDPEILLIHNNDSEFSIGKDVIHCGGYFARYHNDDMNMEETHCIIKRIFFGQEEWIIVDNASENSIQIRRFIGPRYSLHATGTLRDGDDIFFGQSNTPNEARAYTFRLLKSTRHPLTGLYGNYLVNDTALDRGAFGKIFVGRHRRTGKIVAIKRIDRDLPINHDWEHWSMHHLDYHPNIVYYKERYQEEGRVYYVLEFADGGSLWDLVSDRCKRGVRLAEEEVRGLSRQICIGLQYIHRSGIAHLDIKPENILLTRRGQVKIADFGHSKDALSNEGLTSFGVGSPGYRAPEIISRNDSHETYTVKADCYSTGVTILFLLLEGKVPFNDDDTLSDAVWRELERQNITLIGRDFISGLVQSNPSERMDMDDALEHPWISPTVPSITAENSSGAEDPSMDNLTANPNEEAAVDTFSLTPPTLSTE